MLVPLGLRAGAQGLARPAARARRDRGRDHRARSRSSSRGCPTPAGKEADRIHFVYWFTTVIAIAVFAVVAAVLAYSVIKFRAAAGRRLGRPADPRPHEARDRLDGDPGGPRHGDLDRQRDRARAEQPRRARTRSTIKVIAAAVRVAVHLPERQDATASCTLPKGRHVKLDITAKDVLHSFWVPRALAEAGRRAGPAQHARRSRPTRTRHVPGDLHRALRPRPRADAQPRAIVMHAGRVRRRGCKQRRPAGRRGAPRARASSSRTAAAAATRSSRAGATGTDRARPRQPEADGGEGEPQAARRVHRGVDRRTRTPTSRPATSRT